MKLSAVRGTSSAVLALGLAACGAQAAASQPGSGTSQFTTRARQVAAQWQTSPAARIWRTGLVLLGPGELTSIPANAGFASEHQKDAFSSGRFRLAGTAVLPSQPLHGRVRWADGSTMTAPLLGAPAAFRQLAANQACSVPPCGQLTITSARPATVIVPTSRGLAVIPGWRFTMAGLSWPVTEAAVAARTVVTLPAAYSVPPAAQDVSGVGGLDRISADGRTLTVRFISGACITGWGARVYQTSTAVVVGSWVSSSTGSGACPAVGVMRSATVRLQRALGLRVVLDVATGQPLVLGGPMRM
jgi:hypothetical protein